MDAETPLWQATDWQRHRLSVGRRLRASQWRRTAANPGAYPPAGTPAARNLSGHAIQGAAWRYSKFGPLLLGRVALFAVLVVAPNYARSEASWQAVRGADLRATLADHELADGVHYAYQFRATGTFTGFNMGKEVHGTWRVAGDQFCWTSAKRGAEEECLAVERRGTSLRFSRDGYETFVATLTPVKPQPKDEVPR